MSPIKRGGFTLVELLVVIAIIALLMSILLPSLARVRDQAKVAVCMSNLKQWGLAFGMFLNDNNGRFMAGWETASIPLNGPLGPNGRGDLWTDALLPYCNGDKKIRFCPSATRLWYKDYKNPQATGPRWSPTAAWGQVGTYYLNMDPTDAGSYGMNDWVYNPPSQCTLLPPEERWRTSDVRNANNVPLFLDALWGQGAGFAQAKAPRFEIDNLWPGVYDQMQIFCINRHNNGNINGVFMDLSIRKVGLKELWKLKWSRTFDVNMNHNAGRWPDWMKKFKDY